MTDNFTHHHLSAECFADKTGPAIMLTQQDGTDEPHSVLLHPWQLRAVCEQFWIIASDPTTQKTIAMLTRRLLVLRDRIDHLDDYLAHYSDSRHADLSYEQTYASATADIAAEFCIDLAGMPPGPCAPTCTAAALVTAPADQPSLI